MKKTIAISAPTGAALLFGSSAHAFLFDPTAYEGQTSSTEIAVSALLLQGLPGRLQ
ncbi:MAG TPA: hypothetical protein VJ969_09435 [Desulfopila sp.]|nr:hypothetical protein [Desulfopila sp.]